MTLPPWREEAITKHHDRRNFDCGDDHLNRFLAQHARQSHDSGAAKTWCAINANDGQSILGFYTITPGQVDFHHVPLVARPSSGGRHAVSGFRLARLAIARSLHGQSLGGHLLANAIARCMRVSAEVGGTALLIDAKDPNAVRWYQRYGAVPLEDRPLSLIISYAEFNKARVAAGLSPL